jgi:hypothetical protein
VFRDFAPAAPAVFDIGSELELVEQLGAMISRGILRPMIVRFAPDEAILRPKIRTTEIWTTDFTDGTDR